MASKLCFLLQSPLWSGLSSDLSCSRRPGSRPCVTFQKYRDFTLCKNWNRNSDLERRCVAAAADVKGAWKHAQEDGLNFSGIHGHEVGMDLPPLLPSLAIALPDPERPIAYETETVKHFMGVANRLHLNFLKPWIPQSILFCSHTFAIRQSISRERFDAICYIYIITFMLDDAFWDRPNEVVLDQLGIDRGVFESHTTHLAYFRHLQAIFEHEVAPLSDPTSPIEAMIWESGEQLRRLSTSCPEWFPLFSNELLKFFETSVNSAGNYESVRDLETFTRMKITYCGGLWTLLLLELAVNVYLDRNVREHPTYEQLSHTAVAHMAITNDIFSYSKEIIQEPDNPHNIIRVLMDLEGLTLPQAAWRTVDIINAHAATFTELEKEMMLVTAVVDHQHFSDSEPEAGLVSASDVRMWVGDLKLMMSGSLHWHPLTKRYRHPLAVFPELRDCEHGTVA